MCDPSMGQVIDWSNLIPALLIQPLSGRNTYHRAKGGTSFTITAAINEYSPKVLPQTMVALAPIVTPRLTLVSLNSFFRSISALGLFTLVKTQLGPQKTPSSNTTLL